MEASSLGHGKFSPRISASLSTSSLDETLVIRANLLQSLLSESVTLDSLSSKSGDTLPSFPPCKLPNFSLIGLGDRLKLFSATLLPSKESSTKSLAKPASVIIGAPTSPRLKNMLKECLSINKWAETSAGWRAPGHVPWESIQEGSAQYWIPEGSYFPPEYFSLALRKARKRVDSAQPSSSSVSISSPSRKSTPIAEGPQDTPSTDFYDMILELDGVKSFFQDIPQDFTILKNSIPIQSAGKLSVPTLVVSNSHFTFQIPLESSSTLARSRSDTLAHRRGKTTPPSLVVKKQVPVFDIPYPKVPTAFLDQPSEASLSVECASKSDTKQTLRFEEMIKNLRLQCSTMELHNLPADASWNSRTPIIPLALGHGGSMGDEARKIISNDLPLADIDMAVKPESSAIPQLQELVLSEVEHQNPAVQRSVATFLRSSSEQPSRPLVKSSLSRPLRPAMAKALIVPTKPVLKSVRFALTHHDLEKEISLSRMNTVIKSTPQKLVIPVKPQTINDQNTAGVTDFPVSADRKLLQRSRSYTQRPSWKSISQTKKTPRTQARSHSLILGSMSPKDEIFTRSEDNDSSVELFSRNMSSSGRSTQSLGRHSLSRIIKGPIFSGRDIKRATFSLGAHEFDENAIRRDSRESPSLSQSLQKKSRMPIPLRNILTRFK